MNRNYTHAEEMRRAMAQTMYRVMDLLEWDLMTYTMFKYECGLLYLEAYLKGDKEAIDVLERRAAYWGWWKLHWYMREKDWLAQCLEAQLHQRQETVVYRSVMGRQATYRTLNDAKILTGAKTKYAVALEDSYCKDLVPALK